MLIRKATLDDTGGIVDVNTGGRALECSIRERYLRGGPWMSVETCAVHINALLLEGQLPLTAELEGKIVAMAEVLFSEEPVWGEMTKLAHLDVIEVHPAFRGRGIGRKLVEFIEEEAWKKGCRLLTVQPSDEARGFYGKLSFDKFLYLNWLVEVETEGFEPGKAEPASFQWGAVRGLELVAGRFQSSYSVWFSAFRDNFAGIHETAEAGRIGGSYYALRSLPHRPGVAALYLWGDAGDVPAAIGRAGTLGFEKVLTVLDKGTAGVLGAEKKREMPIIGKEL